jgi:hypothetical protein
LSVVLQPARKRDWIFSSWSRRASPTFSCAMANFSRPCERGSGSVEPCGVAVAMSWEPARAARAMAWGKVLGWGLADGGAVRAAWASAALEALERRLT